EEPRDSPAKDVGPDHLDERPLFHMSGLDVPGKHDPVPGPGDPVAELYVLDRRPSVELWVEAAARKEDVATDHAASGPEGVGRPGVVDERTVLMDIMVEEVAEPADKAGGGGGGVVRAEESGEIGIGIEPRHGQGDRIGMDGNVGVDEEDERGGRRQG